MKQLSSWQRFFRTGRVEDYLRYREHRKEKPHSQTKS